MANYLKIANFEMPNVRILSVNFPPTIAARTFLSTIFKMEIVSWLHFVTV